MNKSKRGRQFAENCDDDSDNSDIGLKNLSVLLFELLTILGDQSYARQTTMFLILIFVALPDLYYFIL